MEPKFRNRVHNSPLLVPVLSHVYPVHDFPHYIPKIHSNIIFPPTPTSFEWSLSFTFPNKILYVVLVPPTRATCAPISSWFDYPKFTGWTV
jgi:hypothetical protein